MEHPISPLDGRYASKVEELSPIVSERGLMRYRVITMVAWVEFLQSQGIVEYQEDLSELRRFRKLFSDTDYEDIKKIESKINHDVKAVEYFLREHVDDSVWPWIHFACTSEDVNNVSYAFMLKHACAVCLDALYTVQESLAERVDQWRDVPMLSRTHGQPATPTTMGKELAVFVSRIGILQDRLEQVPVCAKWNGASGNLAAHTVAYPEVDWVRTSMVFIDSLGLEWNPLTTQIESHDMQAAALSDIAQICGVLIDLCNDMWLYISNGYFGQKMVEGEVGSSTMPHKVNPIDFENARSNFKIARGLARTMVEELPISTWQRDLSDSTLQRNLGPVFGHYLLALKNLKRGLDKIELQSNVLEKDLRDNPEVLTEAIQTVLRKNGHADAYEQLKALSRGHRVSLTEIREFIKSLDIDEDDRKRLLALKPADYVGVSAALAGFVLD